MTMKLRTGLLLLAGAAAASACTSILGGIDFNGTETSTSTAGTGGTNTGGTNTGGGAPSCHDGKQGGDETDTDCGGKTCEACAYNSKCKTGGDCVSKICTSGLCAAACDDLVQDGTETDVDCGGAACGPCAVGLKCLHPSDCQGGQHGQAACTNSKCAITCDSGWDDCDAAVAGCETDLTQKDNCGTCGTVCSAYCAATSCNDPIEVAVGATHTCAILKDGSVWCWGANNLGQLGDGTTFDRGVPKKVALAAPATAIAAGGAGTTEGLTCALLSDQTVWCWGANTYGQLGVADLNPHAGPVQVVADANLNALTGVTKIAVGVDHACAVVAGALWCWGRNYYGQLGDGSYADHSTPQSILTSGVTDVTAGNSFTCAAQGGVASCWGHNQAGQVGDPATTATTTNSPGSIPGLILPGVVSGPDADHACGVALGGALFDSTAGATSELFCWGANGSGQIGVGTTVNQKTPVRILPAGVAADASPGRPAIGAGHTGVNFGTDLYMWGDNSFGQLGDGTKTQRTKPVKISGVTSAGKLALGQRHSCVIDTKGTLLCWGDNAKRQLGQGAVAPTQLSTPTPVVWP
jgi:alpha-tubulin suppressor-like RCC1 family protein